MHRGGRFALAVGGHQSEDCGGGGLVLDQLSPLAVPPRLARAARRPRVGNVGVEAVLSPENQFITFTSLSKNYESQMVIGIILLRVN